jgi:hypothetical protein
MEQCIFVTISRRDGLQCRQIHLKLLELYSDDALSYSEEYFWSWQFLMDREYIKDAEDWPTPDFSVQLRIQGALRETLLAFVRCIAKATHTSATTVFFTF